MLFLISRMRISGIAVRHGEPELPQRGNVQEDVGSATLEEEFPVPAPQLYTPLSTVDITQTVLIIPAL